MAKKNSFKLLCIGVVAFSAAATVVFVALGGGEGVKGESEIAEGFNSELPDANVESVSDDRVKAARLEEERRKRDEMLQINGSSFGLLEIEEKKKPEEDMDSLAQVMEEQVRANLERQVQEENPGSVANVPEFASTPKESGAKKKSGAKDRAYKDAQEIFGKEMFPDKEEKKVAQSQPAKTEEKAEPAKKRASFNPMNKKGSSVETNSIRAVVHGTHKDVVANSTVKLRLLDPMVIEGVTVPRNSFIYGKVSFSEARIIIKIDNVNYEDNVLPFKGEIYDSDGGRGIYVPDNAVNEAAKEAGQGAVGETPDVPAASHGSALILASNLANKGGQAIKNAVSKGVGKTKANISDNYRVLIKTRDK